jgi:hypothetical protein
MRADRDLVRHFNNSGRFAPTCFRRYLLLRAARLAKDGLDQRRKLRRASCASRGPEMKSGRWISRNGRALSYRSRKLSNSGPLTVPGAGGVGSAVYDAIATAICHLRSSSSPRQAIIVITDGVDEHSRLSLNQLIDLVRSQRAQLFLIGSALLPAGPQPVLARLAC